jgi:plastocyanin
MRRPPFALLSAVCLAGVVLFGLAGCSSGATGGSSGGGTTVVEKNFAFTPNTLTVDVGATVTFANQDSVPHHVNIGNQDLGEQAAGQSVTWKAATAGTYPFSCSIHPSMTGVITVGSGGTGTTTGGSSGGAAPAAPSGGY